MFLAPFQHRHFAYTPVQKTGTASNSGGSQPDGRTAAKPGKWTVK
jgi:hypothetical protein